MPNGDGNVKILSQFHEPRARKRSGITDRTLGASLERYKQGLNTPKASQGGTNLAVTQHTEEVILRYFESIHKHSAKKWPRQLRANPYEFAWPGEDFRERFLHMLMTPKGGKSLGVEKDVLRLILFRCRAAKSLRSAPLKEMKGYRWRYIAAKDMGQYLCRPDRKLRAAVQYLTEKHLIVREYQSGKMKYPYYRPSDDLFKVCIAVTRLNDIGYLQAFYGGRVADKERKADRQPLLDAFQYDGEEIGEALSEFAFSDAPDRAKTFCVLFNEILSEHMPDNDD